MKTNYKIKSITPKEKDKKLTSFNELNEFLNNNELNIDFDYSLEEMKEQKFSIPLIQRTYVWSEVEIGKFCDAIISDFINNRKKTNFGSILVDASKTIYKIHDGQQRLVTLIIFIHYFVFNINQSKAKIIKDIKEYIPFHKDPGGARFISSEEGWNISIDDILKKAIDIPKIITNVFDYYIKTIPPKNFNKFAKYLWKQIYFSLKMSSNIKEASIEFIRMNSIQKPIEQWHIMRSMLIAELNINDLKKFKIIDKEFNVMGQGEKNPIPLNKFLTYYVNYQSIKKGKWSERISETLSAEKMKEFKLLNLISYKDMLNKYKKLLKLYADESFCKNFSDILFPKIKNSEKIIFQSDKNLYTKQQTLYLIILLFTNSSPLTLRKFLTKWSIGVIGRSVSNIKNYIEIERHWLQPLFINIGKVKAQKQQITNIISKDYSKKFNHKQLLLNINEEKIIEQTQKLSYLSSPEKKQILSLYTTIMLKENSIFTHSISRINSQFDSLDHFIPRSLIKWVDDPDVSDNLKDLYNKDPKNFKNSEFINNIGNLIPMNSKLNNKKSNKTLNSLLESDPNFFVKYGFFDKNGKNIFYYETFGVSFFDSVVNKISSKLDTDTIEERSRHIAETTLEMLKIFYDISQ